MLHERMLDRLYLKCKGSNCAAAYLSVIGMKINYSLPCSLVSVGRCEHSTPEVLSG